MGGCAGCHQEVKAEKNMANISWYVNRLRAMSVREVLWRVQQKKLEKAERQTFGKQHIPITGKVFYEGKEGLTFHVEKLPMASCKKQDGNACDGATDGRKELWSCSIPLLGGYDYAKYRKDWHGGFQTENKWPLTFSYDLSYKQKDEIGDARTNWELNRHFQFALLACNYAQTGDDKFLTELSELFRDWNQENPFLHGISWTSVMEVAIRDINWIYTLGFLKKAAEEAGVEVLCEQLRVGIINMTTYISAHFSRYSSANNHVIVEAAAMGIAGIVMDCEEWLKIALSILNHEIPRQNYKDGVNKEVSLHYQSFFMEAVGLLMLSMQHNGRNVPMNWRYILQKMSRYLADCQGSYGETMVFGDDDAGKILDLEGVHRNHYHYVLQLMSLLLPERYAENVTDVSLRRIATEEEIETAMQKSCYVSRRNVCYEEGGVTLLRSADNRAFIGIDHGELGFGSIAAHGHADALSFQMYLEGEPIFADAGTYIYHIDLESRNAFRKTENHNTVTIKGKNQSEMLGAFLWGKRAETTLLWHNLPVGNAWEEEEKAAARPLHGSVEKESACYLEAEHNGYAPVIHKRKFVFSGKELKLYDSLRNVEKEIPYSVHLLLGETCEVMSVEAEASNSATGKIRLMTGKGNKVTLQAEVYDGEGAEKLTDQKQLLKQETVEAWVSTEYGIRKPVKKLQLSGTTKQSITIVTTITWEK